MNSLLYESALHAVPLLLLDIVAGVDELAPLGAFGSA